MLKAIAILFDWPIIGSMKTQHVLTSIKRAIIYSVVVGGSLFAYSHYISDKPVDFEWAWYAAVITSSMIVVAISAVLWNKVYKKYEFLTQEHGFDIDNALVDYYAADWGKSVIPPKSAVNSAIELIFAEQNGVLKFIEKYRDSQKVINTFELPLTAIKKVRRRPSATGDGGGGAYEQLLYIEGLSEKLSDTTRSHDHLVWGNIVRDDFNMVHASALISIGRNTSTQACKRILIKGMVQKLNIDFSTRHSGIRRETTFEKEHLNGQADFWSDLRP